MAGKEVREEPRVARLQVEAGRLKSYKDVFACHKGRWMLTAFSR